MTGTFSHKLVAVMNEKIEPGVVMNALAHMSMGLGAHIDREQLHFIDYIDADGSAHPSISKMPFIILRANSNKISALRRVAREAGVQCIDFTNTMTAGSYIEQLERMKVTKEGDLIYYGCVLFGEWDKVSEITRKFSLWK